MVMQDKRLFYGALSILFLFNVATINYYASAAAAISHDRDDDCSSPSSSVKLNKNRHDEAAAAAPPTIDDEWGTIQVFHGNQPNLRRRPMDAMPKSTSWTKVSQSSQDEIVASLTKKQANGYFVDLASNDAITISNSYALERYLNWKGK